jgi:integrase/recombinase XerD
MGWWMVVDDARTELPESRALFCDEGGGPIHRGTIRNRLRHLLELEAAPLEERFSPHTLRYACATRNYERGVDLVAIPQMLGHWHVGTTRRYVTRRRRSSRTPIAEWCRPRWRNWRNDYER